MSSPRTTSARSSVIAAIARPVLLGVVLTATLLPLALSAGCGGPGPLEVRKVLVDVEPTATGVDREQMRAAVDKVLHKSRAIRVVEAGRGDAAVLRVRIEGYGPPTQATGPQTTTLALTVEVTGLGGEVGPGGLRGHAVASGAGLVDARLLVDQALRDALAQVLMTRGAKDLDSPQLVGWLTDADASPEQKRRAIRILGSRRERLAVEPLSALLTVPEADEDKDLAPLALAALTNIGDPGAVDAVIAYSDKQPPLVTKQCIEAVRSMGAPRGRAWLFTLSSGHPDLDVQQQATAALAVLEAGPPTGQAVAETAPPTPPTEAVR